MNNPRYPRDGEGPRWFGLYPAVVADLVDPDGRGRIQVRFPAFGTAGESVTAWATLLTPYADDQQGLEVLPEVDSQVVVGFEAGDPSRPYIVGACWNGVRALPEAADAANNLRTFKTRSGSQLQFDDTDGAAKVTVSMASGHRIVLDDGAQELTDAGPRSTSGTESASAIASRSAPASVIAASARLSQPPAEVPGFVPPASRTFWPSKCERSR